MLKCSTCSKEFMSKTGFEIRDTRPLFGSEVYDICSLSCLTDAAWTLREKQEKLSRSKQIIHTCAKCGPECGC